MTKASFSSVSKFLIEPVCVSLSLARYVFCFSFILCFIIYVCFTAGLGSSIKLFQFSYPGAEIAFFDWVMFTLKYSINKHSVICIADF